MHAPDGFLNAGTAVATGVVSAGTIGMALRQLKQTMSEKVVPVAGITAAFIFAAQMFNFPVAAGTTGHLMGGALAAILLGPHLGALVVTVVVAVQALFFADGGLTALGYNILNMAIVPAYGGYALFRIFKRILPNGRGGIVGATALAAWGSVVLSAAAFSIQWLFGATAPIPFTRVFAAMVGVHVLIGIGEAVISALAVGAVLASRPDLVHGAKGVALGEGTGKVPMRVFVIGGVLVSLAFATIVSQFAVDNPDGLEWVAETEGFAEQGAEHAWSDFLFADYATRGIENETLSLAIAGIVGTLITLLVAWGILRAFRERSPGATA
ncbi:MAG TPA: energy-coupling factor ABC transporter permease [Acidimicrobiia bacterium]|jgi:cobalt/nickel transport system permease protein|nr:energy-coupling factor ABC transporter permease [Acidimicrobiia bacterium]